MKELRYKIEKILKKSKKNSGIKKVILANQEGYPLAIIGKWSDRMQIRYCITNMISLINIVNDMHKTPITMLIIDRDDSNLVIYPIAQVKNSRNRQIETSDPHLIMNNSFYLITTTSEYSNYDELFNDLNSLKKSINNRILKDRNLRPLPLKRKDIINNTGIIQSFIQFKKNSKTSTALPDYSKEKLESMASFIKTLSRSTADLNYAYIATKSNRMLTFTLNIKSEEIGEINLAEVSLEMNVLLERLTEDCELIDGQKLKSLLIMLKENTYIFSYPLSNLHLTIELENMGKLKEGYYLDHFKTLLPYYLIKLTSKLEEYPGSIKKQTIYKII